MIWMEDGGGGAFNLKYLVLFVYLRVMYMMIKVTNCTKSIIFILSFTKYCFNFNLHNTLYKMNIKQEFLHKNT